jgi:GH15 family glucan-1,4-alpha-glucosidase
VHVVRDRKDEATASFLEEYADFLEQHVEHWTVTTEGSLVPGIAKHYIRIHPVDVRDPRPLEDPNQGSLAIANVPPGQPWRFLAKNIVDAGFLELVRYGIRRPDDPVVVNTLRVVDAVLKADGKASLRLHWRGAVLRKCYIRAVGRAGMNSTRKGTIGESVRRRYWFYAATSSFIVLFGPPFTA